MSKKEQKVEDIYKKLSQHEHVLVLPDTYIGSVIPDKNKMWVVNSEDLLENKEITYPPGLYKIYDEIIVNARDHSVNEETCKTIKVDINETTGTISVYNDGPGIRIEIHKELKIYIPEMIFGNLLTSSNYTKKDKIVGGRNGYGAKLANIFSTEFIVETVSKNKKYYQRFYNNMYKKDEPIITASKSEPYTKISFTPDFEKFGIKNLSPDIIALFKKRVYDISACTDKRVKVYLNNNQIKIKTFEDYITMYYDKLPSPLTYQAVNDRWKIGVIFDKNAGFVQHSFVNGIWTYQGGTHVNHVLDQISKEVISYVKTKNKTLNVKTSHIKENITLFIDSTIVNPSFSSQTKEQLTSKTSTFGSKCDIPDEFMKKLYKSGLIEEVIRLVNFKQEGELNKTDFKKGLNPKTIDKLEDALWAGKKGKIEKCRLIITEGDSAKTFAMHGLKVIGRERYGVFPLKGKPLNFRDAPVTKILNNQEFINLKQILGLKQNKVYEDNSQPPLRYGGIIILTDQDVDGSHIRGLIINMIHNFWPSLLQIDGYVQCMSTPIIKAFKSSDTKQANPKIFYTITEYKHWVDEDPSKLKNWKIKYFKGLGTSDAKGAVDTFNDFEQRVVDYVWEKSQEENINKSDSAILLAFDKKLADQRKKWLYGYNKDDILDISKGTVKISDFINKELIHFSNYDILRSIPAMADGFKPSIRKILFGSIKEKLFNKEMKVAQLGASVAKETDYHHGEQSLFGAIIGMAQIFVGSNNINLLLDKGNFGTRSLGGDDASSPRYIFTQINNLTPLIFRKEDEPIYEYVNDDGYTLEPHRYAPIIPFVLVNGASGIGTGFSTLIPCYNPKDIIACVKKMIKSGEHIELKPWYFGFKGKIIELDEGKYQTYGIYEIIDDKTIIVTELPVGTWTKNYTNYLTTLMVDKGKSKDEIIEDYEDRSTPETVNIKIMFIGNNLQKLLKENNLEKKLKLVTNNSTSNMYLFNERDVMTKYSTVYDIVDDFYSYRLNVYKVRKANRLKELENELFILKEKIRFIKLVISDQIIIKKRKESQVLKDIVDNKFIELAHNISSTPSYGYLTDMKLWSLTFEKIEELEKLCAKKQEEYDKYYKLSEEQLWSLELNELEEAYDKWYVETLDKIYGSEPKKVKKGRAKK